MADFTEAIQVQINELQKIKRIMRLSNEEDVNFWLKDGWVILFIGQEYYDDSPQITFVIGSYN